MFSFQWPWLALLLPLPFLVWRLWPRRSLASAEQHAEQAVLIHPGAARAQQAFGAGRPHLPMGMFAQVGLLVLGWIGLVGALMGPQQLHSYSEVASQGYDLVETGISPG